jgi:hypothetical protein
MNILLDVLEQKYDVMGHKYTCVKLLIHHSWADEGDVTHEEQWNQAAQGHEQGDVGIYAPREWNQLALHVTSPKSLYMTLPYQNLP